MSKEPVRIVFENGLVFEPDKIDLNLTQEALQIMSMLDEKVFVIEDYSDPDGDMWHPIYDELIATLIKSLHFGYEHEEFRNHKVQYKFTKDADEEIKLIAFKNFVLNLIFWYPFVCIKYLIPENVEMELTEKHIISERRSYQLSPAFIKEYLDEMYIIPYGQYIEIKRLNRIFGYTLFKLQQVCVNFEKFLGISISIEDFMYLAKKYPRYNELIHMQLDPSKQPAEIEDAVREASKEQYAIIDNDEGFHMIKCLIRDIKRQQLNEVQLVIALKADQDGKTIAHPLNTNFLVGGLNNIIQWYINNIAGRKAAIINNEYMGTSGHSLIQVMISTNSVKLSKTTMDCLTANPIPITVRSKTHLKKINGRRYRKGNGDYKIIDYRTDQDLIGDTIWMRSPVTCACKDGVCRECYGNLYHVNKDLNSAGALAAAVVMEPCVQLILSAKHFQGTNSHTIEFENSEFEKFFIIASTEIIVNPAYENIDEYSVVIRQEDMQTNDPDLEDLEDLFTKKHSSGRRKKRSNDDDDESFDFDEGGIGLTYFTTKFYVVHNLRAKGTKDKEVYEFSDKEGKELFMHDDFINRLSIGKDAQGSYLYIDLENVDPQEFIFTVDVANTELTKPVKAIDRLINNQKHEGCDSIDELVQKMLDLLVEANLDASSVQGEMIIYKLIRRADNVLLRPDFSQLVRRKDYQILTIKTSLKKDPSVDTALSTPYLKYQLVQDVVTFSKHETSDYDLSFRPYLDDKEMGIPLRDVYDNANIQ